MTSSPSCSPHPPEMLQTAEGLCEFTGQRLSWWQAQESCDQRFGHLALGPLDRALASQLPNSVWVGQREAQNLVQARGRGGECLALQRWCLT